MILVLAQTLTNILSCILCSYAHQICDMFNINIIQSKFKIILQQITVMDQMKQNKLSRDNLGKGFLFK